LEGGPVRNRRRHLLEDHHRAWSDARVAASDRERSVGAHPVHSEPEEVDVAIGDKTTGQELAPHETGPVPPSELRVGACVARREELRVVRNGGIWGSERERGWKGCTSHVHERSGRRCSSSPCWV